ncbi:MAG: glycoside hydrolase family 66 protein, partial [Calditrichaceae bacterium]
MLFRLKNIWCITICIIFIFTLQSRADNLGEIHTDRAIYSPGDTVNFNLEINEAPDNSILKIEYFHLNRAVDSVSYSQVIAGDFGWAWKAP